jgi:hypothetical protein
MEDCGMSRATSHFLFSLRAGLRIKEIAELT